VDPSRQGRSKIDGVEYLRTRTSHLRVITAFSQFAIAASGPGPVFDEAVRVTTEVLGTDGGAILQRLPDGGPVLVRAGIGWNEEGGLSGATQASIGAWGALAVRFAPPRSLDDDELDFLQSVANVVALSIKRHRSDTAPSGEREILQTIFDHIPIMISFWDADGKLLHVNREWEKSLGWTLEEARKINVIEAIYPDVKTRHEALEFMRRCDRQWGDFRLQTRYGTSIDMSWARFKLSGGSSIGFGLDISERKERETVLADSESRFAKAFQSSPAALGISTVEDGRIIDVNESWLQIFGYRRDEVIGNTIAELHLAVDPGARAETIQQLRADGVLRNREVKIRRKSGEVRDVIISGVPVILAGEEDAWLSTHIDITDSKRAEDERDRLLESEKVARAAAETALERLRAIESITDTALQNLGLDDLLHELLMRVRGALNADFATVGLTDEVHQDLYQRAVSGRPESINLQVRTRLGWGASGKTAVDGQPRLVHDLAVMDLSHVIGLKAEEILALTRSMICAPLRVGSKIVGVVTAAGREPNHFTDDDLKLLLVVADRVAPAIEQARLVEKVHAGSERLKALSTRLVTAQEEERRRIAVELHDELGQVLTAVKINLQSFERRLDTQARSDLAETVASVDQAMERVRDLALDLRPSVLDDLGLPAALRWYAHRFARDTGIDVHVSADARPRQETAIETACFRVAQEALTNIMRHGQARHVWVDLQDDGGVTALKIRDDGAGFDVVAARERAVGGLSLGLLGMEERVSSLGGEFDVQSVPGQGTWLSARFPASARMGVV
jgi:PAS domain S-box-containing protein